MKYVYFCPHCKAVFAYGNKIGAWCGNHIGATGVIEMILLNRKTLIALICEIFED